MYNNFATACQFEDSKKKYANDLLHGIGFSNIKRCSWNTKGGRDNQKNDIDLIARDPQGQIQKISEKFRSRNYGDFLFEVVADIDKEKPGAILASQSTQVHYHTPDALHIFDTNKLKVIIAEHILRNPNAFLKLYEQNNLQHLYNGGEIWIDGVQFRSFPTYINGELVWRNLCMILSYAQVFSAFWGPQDSLSGGTYTIDNKKG